MSSQEPLRIPPSLRQKRQSWYYKQFKGDRCNRCGYEPRYARELDVHHVDGNPENNQSANLATLCANCHRFTHAEATGDPTRDEWVPKLAARREQALFLETITTEERMIHNMFGDAYLDELREAWQQRRDADAA